MKTIAIGALIFASAYALTYEVARTAFGLFFTWLLRNVP